VRPCTCRVTCPATLPTSTTYPTSRNRWSSAHAISTVSALVKAGAAQAALDDYVVTSPAIRWKSTGKGPTAHVDPRKVAALLERGYTLVIKDAALLSARLQRTCNRLQRELGAYVGANVYFTPAVRRAWTCITTLTTR